MIFMISPKHCACDMTLKNTSESGSYDRNRKLKGRQFEIRYVKKAKQLLKKTSKCRFGKISVIQCLFKRSDEQLNIFVVI